MAVSFLSPSSISTNSPLFLFFSRRNLQCRTSFSSSSSSSSSGTAELEDRHPEKTNTDAESDERNPTMKKKKKKARPSFNDVTKLRWSARAPAETTRYPWQHSNSLLTDFSDFGVSLDTQFDERNEDTEKKFKRAESHVKNASFSSSGWNSTRRRSIEKENLDGTQNSKYVRIENSKNQSFSVSGSNCVELRKKVEVLEDSHEAFRRKEIKVRTDNSNRYSGEMSEEFQQRNDVQGFEIKENKSAVGGIVEKMSRGLPKERVLKADSGIQPISALDFLPWEKRENEQQKRNKTGFAESVIPEPELRRLRSMALRMKERISVEKSGVTQAIVDLIQEKWKSFEVVKLKVEGNPVFDMKKTHNILELKTGGIVIWRSGSSVVLYRGMDYGLPCVQLYKQNVQDTNDINQQTEYEEATSINLPTIAPAESSSNASLDYFGGTSPEVTDRKQIDSLLNGLGPRFTDWSGCYPFPIDADLLPSIVPGYKPPFRLLPYKTRYCLGNRRMTFFRRLARTVAPHFALGRNRDLQGLAVAMVKLWEKSAISKIAIKRGVNNTRNEIMAEELKTLTGGTLVSRNKEYIVFYRGNDFLPPAVSRKLSERTELAHLHYDYEDQERIKASALTVPKTATSKTAALAGTLAESHQANLEWGPQISSKERENMLKDAALTKHASEVKYMERKIAQAHWKKKKAETVLAKVQKSLDPSELPYDQELITEEERAMFRKLGHRMSAFLLIGRRGVFDGVVENMHLHWKHRELVKIIVKANSLALAKHIAISLEAESGGILISLDETTKGYAIVVYRGKNYEQPTKLRPSNLLTKRQALARSLELQRREALKYHILDLRKKVKVMKSEHKQLEKAYKEDGGGDFNAAVSPED